MHSCLKWNQPVVQMHANWGLHYYSGRNKAEIGRLFLKIWLFVDYWLWPHWKCTVNFANQNELWSIKCWTWSENGQLLFLALLLAIKLYKILKFQGIWILKWDFKTLSNPLHQLSLVCDKWMCELWESLYVSILAKCEMSQFCCLHES